MSLTNWLLFLAAALAASGLSFWLYLRREPRMRGRWAGALLRSMSLSLALLLLFDPWVPDSTSTGARRLILLDDSYSMLLPVAPGDTMSRWSAALRQVRSLDAQAILTLSGRGSGEDAPPAQPEGPGSRAATAMRAAVEAGAGGVWLVTDGALQEPDEAARIASDAGLPVEVVPVVRMPVANIAVAVLNVPERAQAGDTVDARVEIAAMLADADSVGLSLLLDGQELERRTVPVPAAGRRVAATFRVPIPERAEGMLRLEARLRGGGDAALAADDVRPAFIRVGERPAGVVILSLRPDWEPRFLVPALEDALGLPVDAFARMPNGRWFRIGSGARVSQSATEARVRDIARRASVVVLHGLDERAPAWTRELAAGQRVLMMAGAPNEGAAHLPGEWYVEARPPASPLAPLLATAGWDELPPIEAPRPLTPSTGGWVGLLAHRDRRGEARALVIGAERQGRRRVVVTGRGYYRWALRGGESRRAYRALWSAIAGWLVEGMGATDVQAVRPARAVVDRGQDVEWLVTPGQDSVRLRVERVESYGVASDSVDVVLDTLFAAADAPLRQRAPAPGEYRYHATVYGEDAVDARGPLAVAAFSEEFVRPAQSLEFDAAGAAQVGRADRSRLHAQAWPWILLVALLCAEWLVRRRQGLR